MRRLYLILFSSPSGALTLRWKDVGGDKDFYELYGKVRNGTDGVDLNPENLLKFFQTWKSVEGE